MTFRTSGAPAASRSNPLSTMSSRLMRCEKDIQPAKVRHRLSDHIVHCCTIRDVGRYSQRIDAYVVQLGRTLLQFSQLRHVVDHDVGPFLGQCLYYPTTDAAVAGRAGYESHLAISTHSCNRCEFSTKNDV